VKGRGTRDAIAAVRVLCEKTLEYNNKACSDMLTTCMKKLLIV